MKYKVNYVYARCLYWTFYIVYCALYDISWLGVVRSFSLFRNFSATIWILWTRKRSSCSNSNSSVYLVCRAFPPLVSFSRYRTFDYPNEIIKSNTIQRFPLGFGLPLCCLKAMNYLPLVVSVREKWPETGKKPHNDRICVECIWLWSHLTGQLVRLVECLVHGNTSIVFISRVII